MNLIRIVRVPMHWIRWFESSEMDSLKFLKRDKKKKVLIFL